MTPERFKTIRERMGSSQALAAQRLGCSERMVRDMELGRRSIKRAYGIALAADYHQACQALRVAAQDAEMQASTWLKAAIEEA